MVKVRVTTLYICEFCQKEYANINDAEKCESICRRLAESPGIEILNLSARSFNALYRANIETVRELLELSDKNLARIKNLGLESRREIKSKLAQYQTRTSV
ncbi:DNA-directed RNA polymerase subunit alpha C-terminal domain-containing protein [Desulfosporosinus orientis]|uniref:DNA-directed RNA polymerase subunit alpha C-terminal domain-containing protein n=1 Tax=Desulfosporosinus orientis TaxID=1563 RepID=UPI0002F2C526|nr:DNA-directed RNA polymerase subunit alpha C-terminal domain-containing protein [Desulfosporosinus orientis]